jgi:hypothetical protein
MHPFARLRTNRKPMIAFGVKLPKNNERDLR